MTLAQFTTKIKTLMKTNFLHKRASSPVMANAKVPVTFEDGNNKTYFDSTVTGADLQKLAGSASMSDTIPDAISAIMSSLGNLKVINAPDFIELNERYGTTGFSADTYFQNLFHWLSDNRTSLGLIPYAPILLHATPNGDGIAVCFAYDWGSFPISYGGIVYFSYSASIYQCGYNNLTYWDRFL